MMRKAAGIAVGVATLMAGLLVPVAASGVDAVEQPLIHYSFDAAANGTTIANEGTAARSDATLTGTAATEGGSLSLTGSQYVTVPTAALQGRKDVTVSMWLKNNYGSGNTAAAYIGNAATKNGYFLLNPSNPSGYVKSVLTAATTASPNTSPWNTEVGPASTSAATSGSKSTTDLALYTTVINGSAQTMSFYLNGAQVGNATYPIPAGGLTNYADLVAYIGRSAYPDAYSKLDVDDYAIYGSALNSDAVKTLYGQQAIPKAMAKVDVPASATQNFNLPTTSVGVPISWQSNDAAIIVTDGVATVTRPASKQSDATVTLTATFTLGDYSDTTTYTVVVPRALSDQENAQQTLDGIHIENADDMRGNFSVPTSASHGTSLSWKVKEAGATEATLRAGVNSDTTTVAVSRPAAGSQASTLVLTATAQSGDATLTKDFTVTVQPMPSGDDSDEAYVWAFFTGEGVGGEKISLAASKGNNALDWNTLNNGTPLFTSSLGEQGLRDPFIMRSHDGDKFYMLATDLKISGRPNANGVSSLNGFAGAQANGSTSIEIWESTDLVHWSAQRHAKVSSDYAGNTWAPEAYWDDDLGQYVVYWASNLYPTADSADRTALTYNRMMYVTTDDFISFSEPKVWIDSQRGNGSDGKGSIDATVQKKGDTYYRVYKDENSMTLRQERSTNLLATVSGTYPTTGMASDQWSLVGEKIGNGQANGYGGTFSAGEGPSLFKANAGDVNGYEYYLFADQPNYHGGPNHYVPMATTDISDASQWKVIGDKMPESSFPTNSDGGKPRHGTVLPVTRAQYQKVLEAYAPDVAVKSVQAIDVSGNIGEDPTSKLPKTVQLTTFDDSQTTANVVWDSIDPASYAKSGTFTVKGVADDDSRMPVEASVTILGSDASLQSLSVAGNSVDVDTAGSSAGVELAVKDPQAITVSDVVARTSDTHAGATVSVADGEVLVTVTAADGVTKAVYKVVLTRSSNPQPDVDKGALQAVVDAVKDLDKSVYTADSWAKLAEKTEAAQRLLSDANATQTQVDAAAKDVNDAIDSLIKAQDSNDSKDSGKSANGDQTQKPSSVSSLDAGKSSGLASTGAPVWGLTVLATLAAMAGMALMIVRSSRN